MSPADCYPDKAETADEVLEALAHHSRREIIDYFENTADADASTVGDLADHIEARVPDRDREAVSTALVHKHLPKLESNGWLEFDQRNGEVRYHGHDSAPQLLREVRELFTE